jgi:hypothetical protein
MWRSFVVLLLVVSLSGCAGSAGYHFNAWDHLDHEASLQPGGSWFADHDAMRHMRCFPAYCAHR